MNKHTFDGLVKNARREGLKDAYRATRCESCKGTGKLEKKGALKKLLVQCEGCRGTGRWPANGRRS